MKDEKGGKTVTKFAAMPRKLYFCLCKKMLMKQKTQSF